MKSFALQVLAIFAALLLTAAVVGGIVMHHRRHLRSLAEAALRNEIRENNDGLQELRGALPTEITNISDVADRLQERAAGRNENNRAMKTGLAVMAFSDASWRAASATGAMETLDYGAVQRYSAAYFEQARLAQLQVTTLDAMMALSSYIRNGDETLSLTPDQARAAETQARLLVAHLRMMSRMSDGVQGAYKEALSGA